MKRERTDSEREIQRQFVYLKRLAFPEEDKLKDKIWADKNRDKWHSYYQKWWKNNKEFKKIQTALWYKRNPEKKKIYSARQRAKDPEKYRIRKHLDYIKHKEKRIATIRLWQRANRHKKIQYYHARCVLKIGSNKGEDCSDKIAILHKERFCHWCCRPLTMENRTIDHVVPLARKGLHIPDNLVAACRPCNSSKSDKLVEEWTWKPWEKAA